jgi:hypothetical protein
MFNLLMKSWIFMLTCITKKAENAMQKLDHFGSVSLLSILTNEYQTIC